MLQAPVLFKNIRSSNIRVVQRCIRVPQGGTGSSVTAGEHKRETSAASQRTEPPASTPHHCSQLHTGPGLCQTRIEAQTKLGSPSIRPQRTTLAHPRQEPQFYPTASAFIYLGTNDVFW